MLSKLFSYKKDEKNIVLRIFGIKYSRKNPELTQKSIKVQDLYDLTALQQAQKLIVFLIPNIKMMTGGIQSIYSICKYSREICPDALCLISTHPGKFTYSHNDFFKNDEQIFRWEQIIENAKNAKEIIIHVPEYFAGKLYKSLKKADIKFLKGIENLQINIINQNIELMPAPAEIKDLFKLTNNITQTIGHHRYATQEVCDKWQIPAHFLSVHIDLSGYKSYPFEEKEKIIVLSPDNAPYKEAVIEKLKNELPDFKLVTVENMTFGEYMDLIARAYFVISFGEGFDGYFNQPEYVGSLGFAVYNDVFFPNQSWSKLNNVYNSAEEMLKKLGFDLINLLNNQNLYYQTLTQKKERLDKLYSSQILKENLIKFYNHNYEYLEWE